MLSLNFNSFNSSSCYSSSNSNSTSIGVWSVQFKFIIMNWKRAISSFLNFVQCWFADVIYLLKANIKNLLTLLYWGMFLSKTGYSMRNPPYSLSHCFLFGPLKQREPHNDSVHTFWGNLKVFESITSKVVPVSFSIFQALWWKAYDEVWSEASKVKIKQQHS